ncbi:hypothetical protein B0H19DRAFT_1129987 [Mycena capillaripes]|nr:hypothetical protein B0H19DRAFT_1129987 [Mycena capillaripes]
MSNSSSTTSLVPSSRASSVQTKDYAAAFASLQSTYGLGGSAPSLTFKKTRSNGSKKTQLPHTQTTNGQRDYQQAFGALSSQFGFTGIAPKYNAEQSR